MIQRLGTAFDRCKPYNVVSLSFENYTVDGIEPEAGRADNTEIKEGQSICYTYNVTPINPQEFSDGQE